MATFNAMKSVMKCKATIFQRIVGYFRYRSFVKTRYRMIQVAIQLKEVRESIEQLRREIHERK